ncbi:AraC family transcriptional regulator [Deinococcus geothermalis]|uniref:AraC family transcriptional regulator n=1 Tax=Deinococcus geothermalis TaxID=68909 RepID=UPI002353B67C|nr:AraC family transcriptional regulator [Deinococcus geothermalis]
MTLVCDPPAALSLELARLRELVARHALYDAVFTTRVPGITVARSTRTHEAMEHSVQQPALCIVAQGNKSVQIGAEQYTYNPDRMLVYAVNLPTAFWVTEASPSAPFLTVRVDILETAENERDARWVGPIILDELLMCLLLSPVGPVVAQLGRVDSGAQRVARAIEWIQGHLDKPLNIKVLAERAHLGVSTFYAHFKAVTTMSPLQFQKNLRLQEARRLLPSTSLDVGAISRQVGYASASQFSCDYSRLFGRTPRTEMTQGRARPSGLEGGHNGRKIKPYGKQAGSERGKWREGRAPGERREQEGEGPRAVLGGNTRWPQHHPL